MTGIPPKTEKPVNVFTREFQIIKADDAISAAYNSGKAANELLTLHEEAQKLAKNFGVDVYKSDTVHDKVKALYQLANKGDLSKEQQTTVDNIYTVAHLTKATAGSFLSDKRTRDTATNAEQIAQQYHEKDVRQLITAQIEKRAKTSEEKIFTQQEPKFMDLGQLREEAAQIAQYMSNNDGARSKKLVDIQDKVLRTLAAKTKDSHERDLALKTIETTQKFHEDWRTSPLANNPFYVKLLEENADKARRFY